MSRRKRSREVEIFNFSFLDILACTIGLLIFIMVMVFILQSSGPVADTANIIENKLSEASRAQQSAKHDAQISDALEAALDHVQTPGEPDLQPQRDAARAAKELAQAHYDQANQALAMAQANLDAAQLAQDHQVAKSQENAKAELAAAQAAHDRAEADLVAAKQPTNTNLVTLSQFHRPGQADGDFDILHVDCHADNVILMKSNNGKVAEVGRTAVSELDNPQSEFSRLVAAQRLREHPLILFWIRPDGATTYESAEAKLPESTPHGFEPADADWSFQASH